MIMRIAGNSNLIDTSFCCQEISKCTVVTLEDTDKVRKYKKGDTAYGVSLHTVVNIDAINYRQWNDEVLCGGCIHVIRTGEILIKLDKQAKINSPIYVDAKTGQLTTKVGGKRVGRTLSKTDDNGYVRVEINFRS